MESAPLYKLFAPYDWFWGSMGGGGADEQLHGKPLGAFLIRYSDRSGSLVISWVSGNDGSITHAVLRTADDGGMGLDGSQRSFHSVDELLNNHKKSLIIPVPNPAGSQAQQQRQQQQQQQAQKQQPAAPAAQPQQRRGALQRTEQKAEIKIDKNVAKHMKCEICKENSVAAKVKSKSTGQLRLLCKPCAIAVDEADTLSAAVNRVNIEAAVNSPAPPPDDDDPPPPPPPDDDDSLASGATREMQPAQPQGPPAAARRKGMAGAVNLFGGVAMPIGDAKLRPSGRTAGAPAGAPAAAARRGRGPSMGPGGAGRRGPARGPGGPGAGRRGPGRAPMQPLQKSPRPQQPRSPEPQPEEEPPQPPDDDDDDAPPPPPSDSEDDEEPPPPPPED